MEGVVASDDVINELVQVVGSIRGEKAKSACVDADDGDMFVCDSACHIKECAVASECYCKVGVGAVVAFHGFATSLCSDEAELLGSGVAVGRGVDGKTWRFRHI